MMYYLPPPPSDDGMPRAETIVREDGAWIPADPANRDWIEYQAWRDEGNLPRPFDEYSPPDPQPQPKLD